MDTTVFSPIFTMLPPLLLNPPETSNHSFARPVVYANRYLRLKSYSLYYRIWDNKSAVLPVCFGKYFRRGTLRHPSKKQQRRGPGKGLRAAVQFIVSHICIVGAHDMERRSALSQNIFRRFISAMTAVKRSKRC